MSLEFIKIALTMESAGEGSTPDFPEPECSMNIQEMSMDNHVKGSDVPGIHFEIASNSQLKSLVSEFSKNKNLEETDRSTYAQISCSGKSVPVQCSKSFSVESKLNNCIYTSPDSIIQTSSSAIHNIKSKSRTSQNRLCEEDYLNISRLGELIKRYEEKKSYQSSHVDGGNSSSALFESQRSIAEAEDRSIMSDSKTPQSTQSSPQKASAAVRGSRTLVRTSTTKGMESATEQSKRKARKDQKGKRQDQSSHVTIKNSKVVPSQENKAAVDIKNKPRNVFFPNEGKEETKSKLNALGRRKAYEENRKLDQTEALTAKKGEKISKRQNTNTTLQVPCISNETSFSMKNLKEIPTANVEANTKKRKSHKQPFVDTETDIIGKMMEQTPFLKRKAHTNNKQPGKTVIEVDDLTNEDDFELITQHRYVDEGQRSSDQLQSPWDLQHRPMAQKDIHDHDSHQEVVIGRDVGQSENVDRRPGKELYTQNIIYKPPYCFKYMHPDIAHAYENLNRIPEYNKLKENKGRNVSREKLSSYDIAINQYLTSKPRHVKSKVTVGYVPGYGAVRGMEDNVDRTCRKDKSDNSFLASYPDVMEKQPRPGRPQREIEGHVPGYGPVRGAPVSIKRKPDGPSGNVVLPEINLGRSCNPHGDKRSYGMKKQVDVLESCPKVKPFYTNTNEEASSRFGR